MADKKTRKIIVTRKTFIAGELAMPSDKALDLPAETAAEVVAAGKARFADEASAKSGRRAGQPIDA